MITILAKRFPRELKENYIRYMMLVLLIVMGMYIVVSVVGASYNITQGTESKRAKNKIEDGEFTLFYPLDDAQMKNITDEGITIEEKFSFDVSSEDGKVLRFMKLRNDINLLELDEGELPQNANELVLDRLFAFKNNVEVGDKITIQREVFRVVGIGCVPDYDLPLKSTSDMTQDSESFGCVFVTDAAYEKWLKELVSSAEDYTYAYRLNGCMDALELKEMIESLEFDYEAVSDIYFREMIEDALEDKKELEDGLDELSEGAANLSDGMKTYADSNEQLLTLLESMGQKELAKELRLGTSELLNGTGDMESGINELRAEMMELLDEAYELDINNLAVFMESQNNPRIASGAASDVEIKFLMGLVAGVIIMILFTYVISVFVAHTIQTETSIIGAFYALGLKKRDLIIHYLTIPTLVAFLGGAIGTAIGFSEIGVAYQMTDSYYYYSIPDMPLCYPAFLIVYGLVMPPVISVIVNYVVVNKKLSATPLSLIKNEQTGRKHTDVKLKKLSFISTFQIRQTLKEMRAAFAVILGILISMIIFIIGINCYVLCKHVEEQNIADTKYEYMYLMKYPTSQVPEGAEACYMEQLKKEYLDYSLDVSVVGIDADNPYYDVEPVKGENCIIASSAVAQKYDVSIGEILVLTDTENNRDYAFQIKDIAEYSVGLTVFMDIDSMRELFEKEEDYYNVLLADKEIDIDEGRAYSITTKTQIVNAAGIFSEQMNSLVMILCGASFIIFCAVMYLMMNVMVERSAFGISLVKIFGYRMNEIRKLYLSGNFYVVALGTFISIILAKKISDSIYPAFIANTAMGMDLSFTWQLYAAIYIGALVIYWLIETVLVTKLKKIIPADVLKNRE